MRYLLKNCENCQELGFRPSGPFHLTTENRLYITCL